MKVKDLMRVKPKTVREDTLLDVVWDYIAKKQIYMVPVIDKENHILGIITAQDLLVKLIPDYKDFFSNFYPVEPTFKDIEDKLDGQNKLTAGETMCKKVFCANADHDVYKALSRMIAYNVRVLPVLNDDRQLVGYIVEKDIFTHLFNTKKKILARLKKAGKRSK